MRRREKGEDETIETVTKNEAQCSNRQSVTGGAMPARRRQSEKMLAGRVDPRRGEESTRRGPRFCIPPGG